MTIGDDNMTEILSAISNLANFDPAQIRIRFVTNDKDEVVQILVIVNDETIAKNINSEINKHDKEGVFRYFASSSVEVKEKMLSISSGMKTEGEMKIVFAGIIIILFNHIHQLW